eukprot:TRINITY_DN16495_c0_g1_i1.p1 TRINITY_DN16495_c0_g1~~TRINITY_DN16495_c0_g1_i1.p1  ORF type:complete len:160 (-),score=57.41 TRINITY_DN16495_c0_g1_i1:202-681(-)
MTYSTESLVPRRSHSKHQRRILKKRERVYKLSVRKLKNIYDKEDLLCKTVLINNTLQSLRSRRNSESDSTSVVQNILNQAVAPPPLIEDIEDLSDTNISDPLEDAVVPGDTWLTQKEEDRDEDVVPNISDEENIKTKHYRIQSNPKRDGRRNQTTNFAI